MKIKYELLNNDTKTKARYGLLHTNYGTYETPMFISSGAKVLTVACVPTGINIGVSNVP